jgi:hypothetical protein
MQHTVIRSKMKKGTLLISDPIISRYVPRTEWFDAYKFNRLLSTYTTVYIKPDIGRKGNGVIRVKKTGDSEAEISSGVNSTRCPIKNVYQELQKRMRPDKKYLMQQGIELATYHKRPFDVRIVLQKPFNRWETTLMCAKVAPAKNSVVTNVSKGAKDVNLYRALRGVDQPINSIEVMRDLLDVSFQIAQILNSRYPLKILGLDMAVDQKGKVWFIEANTKPDCGGLSWVDPQLYRKYVEAKKMTRKR